MKISLVVIGKTNGKFLIDGINEYTKRLSFYIPFNIVYLPDIKNNKKLSFEQQKTQEGAILLGEIDKSDYVVLLDEHGKEFTSIEFSRYIEKKMTTVSKRLVFVVGGPYGFSNEVKERANEKISLSKMTFSHEMIRLIFTEQLYRAMTIINNEPYHHE
ncbi:MAG: 23S rRNA (pseudouridine(1915)-N(3))-methyltransferase RlmH [Muribaculaceae bacterium]|mgnify:FL=1|nr:23S rRNA (pseudouridine(1915)-N(3))-methyltransferase RlmH [Muribaculaceae bacterium]MEE1297805.1 23S rRNA (pseudouridine(1915)-N(3))-methyltransferase RlmH [Muribaculaceae bacterium]